MDVASANFLSTLPRGSAMEPYKHISPGPGRTPCRGGDPEGVRCVLINNSGGVLFPLFLYPGQYWRLFTRNNIDANHSNISAAYKPGGTGKHSFIYNFKGRWI